MTTVHGKGAGRRLVWLLSLILTACAGSAGDPAVSGDDPAAAPTTVPIPATTVPVPEMTVPDVQLSEGVVIVETSLGTWQWVRDDGAQPDVSVQDDQVGVELPAPPLPEIEGLVWPQFDPEHWGHRWGPSSFVSFPISSGVATIAPAYVLGYIDWNLVYTNDGSWPLPMTRATWVESRWRLLDGDCQFVDVCLTQTATLEIIAGSEGQDGGLLDVLAASIVPGDPDVVEFRHEETGDLIVSLEATEDVSAQRLLRAGSTCDKQGGMCGGGAQFWELYVDGVGWIEPPWRGLEMWSWPGVIARVRDDGFWIVGFEGPRDSITVHVWGSSDGVEWEEIATPLPLGDSFPNGFQADLIDGELVILTPFSNPDEPPVPHRVLRLADGEFTEVDVDLSALGFSEIQAFTATPWGWIATTAAGTCDVWVSADGTMWEEIDTLDGTDLGSTVNVFTHEISDDGSYMTADNPVPTSADLVSADIGGSHCSVGDNGSVDLDFEHLIEGTGTAWEGDNYPDFFHTTWVGGLDEGNR
jgi:hypothetical protein